MRDTGASTDISADEFEGWGPNRVAAAPTRHTAPGR